MSGPPLCFICGKVTEGTICKDCLQDPQGYDKYVAKFQMLMDQIPEEPPTPKQSRPRKAPYWETEEYDKIKPPPKPKTGLAAWF